MDVVAQLEEILSQLGTTDKILLAAPSPYQDLATTYNCEQQTSFASFQYDPCVALLEVSLSTCGG